LGRKFLILKENKDIIEVGPQHLFRLSHTTNYAFNAIVYTKYCVQAVILYVKGQPEFVDLNSSNFHKLEIA
jgi:hypothetical protein